jgi:hypothetical protein
MFGDAKLTTVLLDRDVSGGEYHRDCVRPGVGRDLTTT